MASPMKEITVKDRKYIKMSIIARERRVKRPPESIVHRARRESAIATLSESMGPRPGITRRGRVLSCTQDDFR